MANERAVGLVGLGLVGQAIAARLKAAGFGVLGYDISPDAMRAFDGNATKAALKAKRIILAVFDTADVERAVSESSASLYIDCTTGDPARIETLVRDLAKRNIQYVEAPLSGSSEVIRRGEATMFVGGDSAGCDDLLAAISARRIPVGPVGTGARAKLAINLVLGLNRVALAEGMAFAESVGIERRQFLELLRASPAASAAALAKGEKMVRGDFAPESRIRQHLKDVQHILRNSGAALPLTAAHEKLLADAIAAGDGDLDNAAIILQYTRGQT